MIAELIKVIYESPASELNIEIRRLVMKHTINDVLSINGWTVCRDKISLYNEKYILNFNVADRNLQLFEWRLVVIGENHMGLNLLFDMKF